VINHSEGLLGTSGIGKGVVRPRSSGKSACNPTRRFNGVASNDAFGAESEAGDAKLGFR